MKKISYLLGAFLGIFSAPSLFAAGWKLHLGATVSNLEERITAPPGFASKVSETQGLLGVSKALKLSNRFALRPESFVLLPWRKGFDGTTLTFTSHFGLSIDFQMSKTLSLGLGNGLLWEMFCSKGEAISLGNGTGTSTYYTPSRWTQVILPTANINLEWKFSKRVGLQIGVLLSEYLNSSKRRVRGLGKVVIDL
ncbi:MAG: hypothetical protein EBQ92_09785 [Proteobacteria bacterium]|nr:hypothetical protein [Pseudomonadota bacterium]